MNYTSMPSLRHTSVVKIAILLWNQDDIRKLMQRFDFPSYPSESRKKWQKIENIVIEKVPELLLPDILKSEILNCIRPIGLRLLEWMDYHVSYLGMNMPSNLTWTSRGTVDKKKTAAVLINDESLDISTRYKLACIYCFENDIPLLWNEIPKNLRRSFYSEKNPEYVKQDRIVTFWTYHVNGEVEKVNNMEPVMENYTCYQNLFALAAFTGNKEIAEYSLQKMTPPEIGDVLVRYAAYSALACFSTNVRHHQFTKLRFNDVLCFLLSQMNDEQQKEVFIDCPYFVLKSLLDWPWQDVYMATAEKMWYALPQKAYFDLLWDIADKAVMGDYNYQELFALFWQKSPNTHKNFVIDECGKRSSLAKLFQVNDKRNIMLILKNATVVQRMSIISCNDGIDICETLIYDDKWDLLQLFSQECILSKGLMIMFKKQFQNHISKHAGPLLTCRLSKKGLELDKDKLSKFFKLLDNLYEVDDRKRNIQDSDSSPAKKRYKLDGTMKYC